MSPPFVTRDSWFVVRGSFLTSVLAACVTGCSALSPRSTIGVLILAHGGSRQWNRAVETTVAQAHLIYPTEIAFGMGMHPEEVQAFQRAIRRLERRKISRLVVVPLLVSSSSEVMRQFQYLFGLREHGPWEAHVQTLALQTPITMTRPLDDDPLVAEVLAERAAQLSRSPQEEIVVLVAHGPSSDEDEIRWLEAMERLAGQVQERGGFREVVSSTMRDDAPKPVQEEAIRRMRELIERCSRQGRTLVVPLLLANGGIETKIPKRLEGLTYIYGGQALLPHDKLALWIAHQVEHASASSTAPVAHAERL